MIDPELTRRDFVAAAAAAVPDFNVYQSEVDEKVDANAKRARKSFQIFRKTIRPDMIWNPFVLRLTRELQRFGDALVRGARPKLVISTPAQHGKSIAAEDFSAWIAGRLPDFKTIYASYSEDLGVRCNLNLQRLFMSERYRYVFPTFEIGHTHSKGLSSSWQLNSGLIEYVGHKGSFRNTTVRGQITGMELNLGIIDDFVKGRAEASSKVDREKTWVWFTDDFMTRHSKDSAVLIIATRWHLEDMIGRLEKKWPQTHVLNFPAIAEKDEIWRKKGEALFPEHKPLDFLLERKALMTEASWAAEYQGHPFLVGSGEIPIEKLKTLQYFDRNDVAATVLSVDKAGTEGGDGAQTAIVIMHRMKNGTYVIENIICGRWASLEREKYIKAWADYMRNLMSPLGVSFKVVIEIEPGSGGKEFYEASVRNLAGHNVFGDKPGAVIYLGIFDTEEEAIAVRRQVKESLDFAVAFLSHCWHGQVSQAR